MAKRQLLFIPVVLALFFVGSRFTGAQDDSTNIRVNVDLVQLNVAVTDNKGNYVSGLGPENFAITEDKIQERLSTFEEGNEPARQLAPTAAPAAGGNPGAPSPKSEKASLKLSAPLSETPPAPATVANSQAGLAGEDP